MCEKVGTMLMEKTLMHLSALCKTCLPLATCWVTLPSVATLQEAGRRWRTALSVLSLPTYATLVLSFAKSVVCITKREISCGL